MVVQVKRPMSQFNVRSHEYDLLRACVTLGGVATSSGDFWWTWKVDREAGEAEAGEKAAMVGGFAE